MLEILIELTMLIVHFSHLLQDKLQLLLKFGEWDVYNPALAERFTVICSKAPKLEMRKIQWDCRECDNYFVHSSTEKINIKLTILKVLK